MTRSPAVSARRENGKWRVTTKNSITGETREFLAKCLVNAAGPWVTDVLTRVAGANSTRNVRLVKGSHIIVPKFWEGPHSYLVQNDDKRVIFINAYEGNKALIGTTDIAYDGRAEDVAIDDYEISYLLDCVNRYFKEKLRREDILETFSGVRPLFDDGHGNPSAVTRDYVFDLDEKDGAPLLNIFGGKITTFRELAERGMHEIRHIFPKMGKDWTESAPLPGGDMPNADYTAFGETLKEDYPWMSRALRDYYGRRYGTLTSKVVGSSTSLEGLGRYFGAHLYEAEVNWLVENEWAITAEDIIWRRTKHRLDMTNAEIDVFENWFETAYAVAS